MYDRIVLNINEGSNSLPSILNFNETTALTASNASTINNASIRTSNKETILNRMAGSIGDRYNEFSVDFVSSNILTKTIKYTKNVQDLYNLITNDDFISVSKTKLLNTFKIFEFDDYSYQAMSVGNYDFYPKLFVKIGDTEFKVAAIATAVIKSYTLKKAWLLFDADVFTVLHKTLPGANITYKILIDFTYKYFYDEITGKSFKYQNVSNGQNIQALFRNATNVSPYFDRYYSDTTTATRVVNSQSNYFKLALLDLFKDRENNTVISDILNNSLNIYKTVADSTSTAVTKKLTADQIQDEFYNNVYNLRLTYIEDSNELQKCLMSAAYEVYNFSRESEFSTYFGRRIITKKIYTGYSEVYPIPADMIHYLFSYDSAFTPTVANMHNALFAKKLYQWDYSFKNVYTFEYDNVNYVEVYMPFSEEYVKCDSTIINTAKNLSADNISTLNSNVHSLQLSNDYRSPFDPTLNGQVEYTYDAQTINSKYILPVYGVDSNIRSLMSANTDYISIVTDNQITGFTIDDVHLASVYNKYFDIKSVKENSVIAATNNVINSSDVINAFTNAGFRNNSKIPTLTKTMLCNIRKQHETLCYNILRLVSSSDLADLKSEQRNMKSLSIGADEYPLCILIYAGENSTLEDIEYNIYYKSGNQYAKFSVPQKPVADTGGVYVIPYDVSPSTTDIKIKTISVKNKLCNYKIIY